MASSQLSAIQLLIWINYLVLERCTEDFDVRYKKKVRTIQAEEIAKRMNQDGDSMICLVEALLSSFG